MTAVPPSRAGPLGSTVLGDPAIRDGASSAADSTTRAPSGTRVAVDELSRTAAGLRTSVARSTH